MWLTILLSCIIAICAVLAVVYIVRRKIKNKGKCSDCSGHCYGCTSCTYAKEQAPHKDSGNSSAAGRNDNRDGQKRDKS